MLDPLPRDYQTFAAWDWSRIEPYYAELERRPLDAATVHDWLADWSRLAALISETDSRLYVDTTLDTEDEAAARRYERYLEDIVQPSRAAAQKLKDKLLASGLEPDGLAVPMRDMRAEAEIFREANLPLQVEEEKLKMELARVLGTQTVVWDGEERTVGQMRPVLQGPDRAVRERAWRQVMDRALQDRETINGIWVKLLALRRQIAANAGMPDYRAYIWKEMCRFDYTPDDCRRFHDAIEEVVVPAAERIYARYARNLGYKSNRPWDRTHDRAIDASGLSGLRPFEDAATLVERTGAIFRAVDPQLGQHFDVMVRDELLDLEARKGKGPGGYCTDFAVVERPFIFMNAVGIHDDVQTLLHEGGHAFHVFEAAHLPYTMQKHDYVPIEFAEVASMGMELLGGPYLARPTGFYDEADAARARVEHLESMILFWPYMAVVDAFQHWVYMNPDAAADPANCDATWLGLWRRFMRGEDWSGLDAYAETGWHRKHHIFRYPFYYIEYGLAQLGAVQVWRNSLTDRAGAVAAYRRGLALGGTAPLPELFRTAGARFQPDAETLRACVDLIEETIGGLTG